MKSAHHKRANAVGFHFYEVPRGVRFTETGSRMETARAGAGGGSLTGMESQFGKMKVLEADGGDGCTTM